LLCRARRRRGWPRRRASIERIGDVHCSIDLSQRPTATHRRIGRRGRFGSTRVLHLIQQPRNVHIRGRAQSDQHYCSDGKLENRIAGPGRARPRLLARGRTRHCRASDLGDTRSKSGCDCRWRRRNRCRRRGSTGSALKLRDDQGCLAARTLDLVPGPFFIAQDVLSALTASEFDVSHKRSSCPGLGAEPPGRRRKSPPAPCFYTFTPTNVKRGLWPGRGWRGWQLLHAITELLLCMKESGVQGAWFEVV
jgi:hypothetical protein